MSSITNIDKDNSLLIDIQYVKRDKQNGLNDYLYLIYKDVKKNKKKMVSIEKPKMTIYFEKPEYRTHDNNHNYAKRDECNPVTVEYANIMYAIANEWGDEGKNFLQTCFETKNYRDLEKVQMYPYVFGSDYDIRTWYRYYWKKSFNPDINKHLSKGFMDIEVDSYEAVGFPTAEENPIDLVTVIDADAKQSYTFMLIGVDYYPKYNLDGVGADLIDKTLLEKEKERKELYNNRTTQHKYWSTHIDELKEEAHKMFDESYPGMEYNFYFYKDECMLLVHLFQLINKIKFDFMGIWNIAFDIPYIINRCVALGLDPKEVICPEEFPNKECYFKKDNLHFDIKNKTDFFRCSSYTVYIDQMVNYAAIRKGGSELRGISLNYIGQKELKDEKLDYSDSGNIKTVSYNNYLQYVLYNIKDVLLQYGIENKTHDMDTYYVQSYANLTPYEDNFKQTKALRNVIYESFMSQGLIPGNNINAIMNNRFKNTDKNTGLSYDYDGNLIDDNDTGSDDDVGYEGALVGDPSLNDYFGKVMYGKHSKSVFDYGIDLDMSAFYPNTVMAFNIDPSCLIFKMSLMANLYDVRGGKLKYHGITDVQHVKKNKDSFSDDIGKEISDNFKTRHYITFGHKWLNLPSVTDIVRVIEKERSYSFEN